MTSAKLADLYTKAESYDEEVPLQLAKQIETYAKILQELGKLHALSVYDFRKARADRKLAHGLLVTNTEGTGVIKEGTANVGTNRARTHEAEKERDMRRWENAYDATKELIQAKKKSLELLSKELFG